ncbi:MAG: type VI secretion system lipoprotein TssJ [Nannocystaceae bacterium]
MRARRAGWGRRRAWAGLLTALLLSACRPPPVAAPCDAPTSIDVVIDGDARINPGEDGEPWPTHVRIYQLDAAPPAEGADPRALDTDEAAALGRAPLSRHERVLYPDSRERWSVDLEANATHLAIVGRFHGAAAQEATAVVVLPPAPTTCPAADAPPPCVYAIASGSQLRGGLRPPPGFVGDGRPCRALPREDARSSAPPRRAVPAPKPAPKPPGGGLP